MQNKNLIFLTLLILFGLFPISGRAEKVSLKMTYNSNSIAAGDLETWINSTNSLWQDWHQINGGQMDGEIPLISYGPSMEIELRINLFAGLFLNLGGTQYSSIAQGQVSLLSDSGQQTESQSITNDVSALPLKIGFSYSYILPFFENLSLNAGFGRHITLVKYSTTNQQKAEFIRWNGRYTYQNQSEGSYRSEALGMYATFAVELELFKYIALVAEAEKVWSEADGFKGSYESHYYENLNGIELSTTKSGKATLYYFESDPLQLGRQYSMLAGEKKRPEDPEYQNLRQGLFNFDNTVFKVGIRFKF